MKSSIKFSFMEEWKKHKATEYCLNVTDGTHDSPKRVEQGKYLITSKHIKGNQIDFSEAYKISFDDYNQIIKRSKVDQWDVIISMIGAYCGFCYIEISPNTDYAIKNVGLFKVGSELKSRWLYYYLSSPLGKQQLALLRTGSSQPYIALNSLRNLMIPVPEGSIMRRIVNILHSLDDKIEVNRRINDNLEQQAQALFKSWFVDFEPFRDQPFVESELGMIPEGWRVETIGELCSLVSGFAFQSCTYVDKGLYRLVTIKNVQDGYLNSDGAVCLNEVPSRMPIHCLLKIGDILLSLTGNVGRCCFVNEKRLLLNQRVAKIIPNKDSFWGYIYTFFRNEDIKTLLMSIAKGTAQANLSPVETLKLTTIVPTNEVIEKFSKIVNSLYEEFIKNTIESRRLAQLRDTLLPRLMSGEIKVGDVTL